MGELHFLKELVLDSSPWLVFFSVWKPINQKTRANDLIHAFGESNIFCLQSYAEVDHMGCHKDELDGKVQNQTRKDKWTYVKITKSLFVWKDKNFV
uniref:Uncharacterized protein n=1 Tax=Rhizophora mucronata TaxID=61149 RepID=A0A2P2NHW6_RHIMU